MEMQEPQVLYEEEFSLATNELDCIKQICQIIDKSFVTMVSDCLKNAPTNFKR